MHRLADYTSVTLPCSGEAPSIAQDSQTILDYHVIVHAYRYPKAVAKASSPFLLQVQEVKKKVILTLAS